MRFWNAGFNMEWYYYIAWAAIAAQLFAVYYAARNYRYALSKYERRRQPTPEPCVALIIPCKGLDGRFQTNIASNRCPPDHGWKSTRYAADHYCKGGQTFEGGIKEDVRYQRRCGEARREG